MTTMLVGRLVYGTYWRVTDPDEGAKALLMALEREDEGAELDDLVDVLCEEHNASVAYLDGTYTIYYGHIVTDLSTAENKFDEMALLRCMDLKRGVLEDSLRDDVKRLIETVPYSLR
jgi:hypothetical protein